MAKLQIEIDQKKLMAAERRFYVGVLQAELSEDIAGMLLLVWLLASTVVSTTCMVLNLLLKMVQAGSSVA